MKTRYFERFWRRVNTKVLCHYQRMATAGSAVEPTVKSEFSVKQTVPLVIAEIIY